MNYFTIPGVPQEKRDYNFNYYFQLIEDVFSVTKTQLRSKTRKREVVFYRQLFCYILAVQKHFETSLAEIGKQIDRDHTTVLYSRDTIKGFLDIGDTKTTTALNKIQSQL